MNLAQRALTLRESRGLDKKQSAIGAGVDPSVITLIEKDARNGARPETLIKIAEFYNVTVGYLLGVEAENYMPVMKAAAEHGLTPDDLVHLIRNAGAKK